jgi:EAL domain-containing protein (putative c-di-GMP-specific phosphodiesterase class I)
MSFAWPILDVRELDSMRAGLADVTFEAALERLCLAFQPIVDAQERRTFGYEALVRSGEPSLSNPGALFDAAERLGRTLELGRRIRALAGDAARRCPEPCALFVNLHPSDLLDPELYDEDSALARHASRVVLEITERAPLDRVPDVQTRIAALRRLGYRIALDDLGAGYAGLTSLALLAPDIVKLDMSLVRGLESSRRARSIVRALLELCARDLEIDVVSEGVETASEASAITSLGGFLLQGYHFGRPSRAFCDPFAERAALNQPTVHDAA